MESLKEKVTREGVKSKFMHAYPFLVTGRLVSCLVILEVWTLVHWHTSSLSTFILDDYMVASLPPMRERSYGQGPQSHTKFQCLW
jgi:hypothetical protein